jgi:hypothetical protein
VDEAEVSPPLPPEPGPALVEPGSPVELVVLESEEQLERDAAPATTSTMKEPTNSERRITDLRRAQRRAAAPRASRTSETIEALRDAACCTRSAVHTKGLCKEMSSNNERAAASIARVGRRSQH